MAAVGEFAVEVSIEETISTAVKAMGYSSLTAKQEEVVRAFAKGNDVFVSLPTGSGKSLCYCILPLVFDSLRRRTEQSSIVVVVSPLVALMKDQVRGLEMRKIKAVYVGDCEDDKAVADICEGKFQIVYISPESLLTDARWRDMLLSPVYRDNLVGLVVDEAHCVKMWGETFRREFSHLGEARSLIPAKVNLMALTATATKTTRKQVCRQLGMIKPIIIAQSPNRANIKYSVRVAKDLEETFAPLVEEVKQLRTNIDKIIIFCRTHDDCSHMYLFITSRLGKECFQPVGAPNLARFRIVDMFTSCTHPQVKDSILQSFSQPNGILRVVIATVAFGMGLDCPNVRRIFHWGAPNDLESYVQETGRAGRDGKPAQAVLYNVSQPSNRFLEKPMKKYCKNRTLCRRQLILQEFDAPFDCVVNCTCCDVCELSCTCPSCS